MKSNNYTEDQLVEQPAIGLFAALGWHTISAMEETLGTTGTLGRETKGEVVLVERLRIALTKLNQDLPPEAIQTAIDELARDRSAMSLEAANREIYKLLKEGIPVSIPDRESHTLNPSPRGRGGAIHRTLARGGLGKPRAKRFPVSEPAQCGRQPLHLPARSRRFCEWLALGGDRTEETRRASAACFR